MDCRDNGTPGQEHEVTDRIPLDLFIICEGHELETYGAKKDGPNSIRAYVASEAGKEFKIVLNNNLSDFDLDIILYIDGEHICRCCIRAREWGQIQGIPKTSSSVLPFKFQELQLVDPDVENAPVVPEMGTIELQAFRCQIQRTVPYPNYITNRLRQGRVSERSKKAGWHHVNTADEVPTKLPNHSVSVDTLDPLDAPFASVKIFYRPRELLVAGGVISTRCGMGARIGGGGSEANDRKHTREDHSPGPSTKRRTRTVTANGQRRNAFVRSESIVKKEEMSANARAKRIQVLQAESDSLNTEEFGSSSVECELKYPSQEVIDLTLDD